MDARISTIQHSWYCALRRAPSLSLPSFQLYSLWVRTGESYASRTVQERVICGNTEALHLGRDADKDVK